MYQHVSTSPPTWGTRILAFFGYAPLPTKVNCWYCNHNSYILSGSKQTVHNWHCGICESDNARDDNGDIADPVPWVSEQEKPRRCSAAPQSFTGKTPQKRSLCEDCEYNQAMIYRVMNKYTEDEDEDDTNLDSYVSTMDEYRSILYEKYPLCGDCQKKVDELVAEQKLAIRSRILDEILTRSLATPVPIKPTKLKYTVRGVIWMMIHVTTIMLCLYASHFALVNSTVHELPTTAPSTWRKHTLSQETRHTILEDVTDLFVSVLQHGVLVLYQTTASIYSRTTGGMLASYQWPPLDYITLLYVVNTLSYFWIGWHPLASKTFQEKCRMKRIDIYMNIQRAIFLARFILIWIATATNQTQIVAITMKSCSLLIPMILIMSVFIVEVPPGNFLLRTPLRLAHRVWITFINALTRRICRKEEPNKRAWDKFQKAMQAEMFEHDLDSVVAGIHKLKI